MWDVLKIASQTKLVKAVCATSSTYPHRVASRSIANHFHDSHIFLQQSTELTSVDPIHTDWRSRDSVHQWFPHSWGADWTETSVLATRSHEMRVWHL